MAIGIQSYIFPFISQNAYFCHDMKRISTFFILVLSLFVLSCSKPQEENDIVLNMASSIEVPAAGGNGTITANLLNSKGWDITTKFSGCVSSAIFDASASAVKYSVSQNTGQNSRTGQIMLIASKAGRPSVSAMVQVTQKGSQSSGGGGGDGGDDNQGDSGDTKTTCGWFELPVVNDKDGNGIDDSDNTLYYAYHSFTMNGRKMRNYAVCFSAEHHCAMWVSAPRHACYEIKNVERTNAYKADPDIPSKYQCSSKETGGGCNKGHLLGSEERLCCDEANRQVFYYSNIAPQFSTGYNTGGGGWNTLEDWVDKQVCADTLYEVVGCYYKQFTDGYGFKGTPTTIDFGGRNDVDRPTMFYYILLRTKSGNSRKALKDCSASELKCAAFVRAHNNDLKGQKVTSKEMMSVSDLEKLTGFTYFPNVPNAPKNTYNASDWGL